MWKFSKNLDLGKRCLTSSDCNGGTTLNNRPIGLYVKILHFNGRLKTFSARYGKFLSYQPIQNRWKFNICFNVWVLVFPISFRGTGVPSLFLTPFQASKRNSDLFTLYGTTFSINTINFWALFIFIYRPYIFISYIHSKLQSFKNKSSRIVISDQSILRFII